MAEVTSDQIQALTDAVTGLSEKIGSMPKGGGGGQTGDFTSQLKENAKGAGKDIAQFAGGLAKGTATVQSFAQAIPLKIFGPFGKMMQGAGMSVVNYVMESKKTFEGLSKVGASLSGDLGLLQVSAAETRMSLPDFAKMVKNNSTLLTQFGGGVSNGIDKFRKLSDTMFKGENAPINTFMRLGMTIEESNEFMLETLAVNQRSARFRNLSEKQQLRQAQEYAKNLDLVSKLTGKNAKELQKEADSRMKSGDMNATLRLNEMRGAKGATEAFQAIQGQISTLPKAAQDLIADTMNLGGPVRDHTALYSSLNPQTAGLVRQLASINKDTSLTAEERKKQSQRIIKEINAQAVEEGMSKKNLQVAQTAVVSDVGALAAETTQQLDKLANAIASHTDSLEKSLGRSATTFEGFNSLMADLQAEQQKQLSDSNKGSAALRAVTESQEAIANTSGAIRSVMGNQLSANETITKGFDKIAKTLNESQLAEKFEATSDALSLFGTGLKKELERVALDLPKDATDEEVTKAIRENAEPQTAEEKKQGKDLENEAGLNIFQKFGKWLSSIGSRKAGGGMSYGNLYNINDAIGPMSGEMLKSGGGDTMLSAEQSNNLITQAVSQSSQDFAKLTETMQSVSDKLDVMIMVNTAQNRNQKQTVDAIKSSGNLFKGGV